MITRGTKSSIYPLWTESRYWAFIRSALRMAWSKYPVKFQVLADARRPSKSKNKKLKWEFQCATCNKWYPQKEIAVDHIVACGTLSSYNDLPVFVRRLFCKKEELQVLCDKCHNKKTAIDKFENNLKKKKDGKIS